jgi:hypothetical protein
MTYRLYRMPPCDLVAPRTGVRGHRRVNNAIHMVAIPHIRQPHSDGRPYFDRKVTEGRAKREALRSLKRHVSNALYRQFVLAAQRGPGGHQERLVASVVGPTS